MKAKIKIGEDIKPLPIGETMSTEAREFWISLDNLETWCNRENAIREGLCAKNLVHVIEKSAYDELQRDHALTLKANALLAEESQEAQKERDELQQRVRELERALNIIGMMTYGDLAYTSEYQDRIRVIINKALAQNEVGK